MQPDYQYTDLERRYKKLLDVAFKLRTHQHNYFASHSSLDRDKANKYGRELDAILIKEKKEAESKQINIFNQ